MRRASRGARRHAQDAVRLGGAPTRPRRARLRRSPRPHRHHPARDQPRACARSGGAREGDPQRVRPPGRGRGRRPCSRRRQPEPADRRGGSPGDDAPHRLALDAAAVPARRGERRRDAPPPLSLARPPARQAAAQHPAPRADGRDHPPPDGGGGLPRHPDADPLQVHPRGRPRLRRAEPPPQGIVLRAAAEPAAPEAADDDRRLRPLLPDRDLLPRRGSPGRPRPGDHPARHGDVVPRPRRAVPADGGDVRRRLARVPRHRDPAAVPAHDLRRGRPALRLGQARHALRARDRGRHRGHARLRVRRLLGRRRGAVPPRAARLLALGGRDARGAREGAGGEGPCLRHSRRGGGDPLADRQVPLRAGARGACAGSRARRCSSPRIRGR